MQFGTVRIHSLGADELVMQTLAFLKRKEPSKALPFALALATLKSAGNPEAYALCAHVLTLLNTPSAALEFWDKALLYAPLTTKWIEKALQTADASVSPKDGSTTDYRALLGSFFLSHPSLPLLKTLSEAGTPLEGSVGIHAGRLTGWAWTSEKDLIHITTGPNAPRLDQGSIRKTPFGPYVLHELDIPLAEHKSSYTFSVTVASRHIKGSPLTVSPALSARPLVRSFPPAAETGPHDPACTVIIPCFDGYRETLSCIASLLASLKHNKTRVLIMLVWDNGPDTALKNALQRLGKRKHCLFCATPHNMGFLGAVNFALAQIPRGACILLNADTLVTGDWIDRMMEVAEKPDCATVTAMGSDAELLSYPSPTHRGSVSSLREVRMLDTACKMLPPAHHIQEIPVGVGFCMLITRKALSLLHGLNGTMLFKGYGEECEFCLRASARNLKNYAACNVYVAHLGGRSFGTSKRAFAAQNNKAICKVFPDYKTDYDRFLREDPLRPVREEIALNALSSGSDTLHVFPMSWRHMMPEKSSRGIPHPLPRTSFLLPCGSLSKLLLRILGPVELEDMTFLLPQDAERVSTHITRMEIRHIRLNGYASLPAHLAACLEGCSELSVTYEKTVPLPPIALSAAPTNVFLLPPVGMTGLKRLFSVANAHPSHIFYVHKLHAVWRATLMPENICQAPDMKDLRPLDLSAVLLPEPPGAPLLETWRLWLRARNIPDVPLGALPLEAEKPESSENAA